MYTMYTSKRKRKRTKNARMAARMAALGISSNDLAARIERSPVTVSRILNLQATPSLGTAYRIAEVLREDVHDLFPAEVAQ